MNSEKIYREELPGGVLGFADGDQVEGDLLVRTVVAQPAGGLRRQVEKRLDRAGGALPRA